MNLDLRDLRDHLDKRLDTIEENQLRNTTRLDSYLERTAKNEADINWMKGHAKVIVSLVIAALGGMASFILHLIK